MLRPRYSLVILRKPIRIKTTWVCGVLYVYLWTNDKHTCFLDIRVHHFVPIDVRPLPVFGAHCKICKTATLVDAACTKWHVTFSLPINFFRAHFVYTRVNVPQASDITCPACLVNLRNMRYTVHREKQWVLSNVLVCTPTFTLSLHRRNHCMSMVQMLSRLRRRPLTKRENPLLFYVVFKVLLIISECY